MATEMQKWERKQNGYRKRYYPAVELHHESRGQVVVHVSRASRFARILAEAELHLHRVVGRVAAGRGAYPPHLSGRQREGEHRLLRARMRLGHERRRRQNCLQEVVEGKWSEAHVGRRILVSRSGGSRAIGGVGIVLWGVGRSWTKSLREGHHRVFGAKCSQRRWGWWWRAAVMMVVVMMRLSGRIVWGTRWITA